MKGLTGGFTGGLNITENLIQQELLIYLSTSIDSIKAKPKLWFTFLIVWTTINVSIFFWQNVWFYSFFQIRNINFRKKNMQSST